MKKSRKNSKILAKNGEKKSPKKRRKKGRFLAFFAIFAKILLDFACLFLGGEQSSLLGALNKHNSQPPGQKYFLRPFYKFRWVNETPGSHFGLFLRKVPPILRL